MRKSVRSVIEVLRELPISDAEKAAAFYAMASDLLAAGDLHTDHLSMITSMPAGPAVRASLLVPQDAAEESTLLRVWNERQETPPVKVGSAIGHGRLRGRPARIVSGPGEKPVRVEMLDTGNVLSIEAEELVLYSVEEIEAAIQAGTYEPIPGGPMARLADRTAAALLDAGLDYTPERKEA